MIATRSRRRPLGPRQIDILMEAASEVASACPWVWTCSDRRTVDSLARRGLVGATPDFFGITPAGVREVRRRNHALAMAALAGLRRNRDEGEVMPWHV